MPAPFRSFVQQVKQVDDILFCHAAGGGELPDLEQMIFDLFQMFLAQQLRIFRGDKAALRRNGIEEALAFQLIVGALGRHDADAQILCEISDRRQRIILIEFPADDKRLDLRIDLIVDRGAALVVDKPDSMLNDKYFSGVLTNLC